MHEHTVFTLSFAISMLMLAAAAEDADAKACFGASGVTQQACKESFRGAEWESQDEDAAKSDANE